MAQLDRQASKCVCEWCSEWSWSRLRRRPSQERLGVHRYHQSDSAFGFRAGLNSLLFYHRAGTSLFQASVGVGTWEEEKVSSGPILILYRYQEASLFGAM